MWSLIRERLRHDPECLTVGRILIENGFNTRNEKIFCNEIEIPIIRVARVARVDQRTVIETLEMVAHDPQQRQIYEHARSTGLSMREIARFQGLGMWR